MISPNLEQESKTLIEFTDISKKFHEFLKSKGEDPTDEARIEDHRLMYSIFVAGAVAQHESAMPIILKLFRPYAKFNYIKFVISKITAIITG